MKKLEKPLRWVTLELTPIGETGVMEATLEKTLRRDLQVSPDFPIFIPAKSYQKRGLPATMVLVEGYAFVGEGLPYTAYFGLEGKPYIEKVLSHERSNGGREPQFISHLNIQKLERKLKNLDVPKLKKRDQVLVRQGLYRGMEGTVLDVISDDDVIVSFSMRSINIVAQLPCVFLDLAEHEYGD